MLQPRRIGVEVCWVSVCAVLTVVKHAVQPFRRAPPSHQCRIKTQRYFGLSSGDQPSRIQLACFQTVGMAGLGERGDGVTASVSDWY